ncbi:hypothetical protein PENTCL1PPCAC_1152, partial [Pristionchus entomophagus]
MRSSRISSLLSVSARDSVVYRSGRELNELRNTIIINGYRLACKETVDYFQKYLSFPVEELGRQSLINAAK